MLDYGILKLIWWVFIGVLLIGFMITGGIDLGVGILLPFFSKSDNDRRLLINAIGLTWEGNQVWLVTLVGAMLAAWPFFYAVAFSGLYIVVVLVLCALILRPPGIDFRSKLPSPLWRKGWDGCLFISSFFPVLLGGMAFGNILLGLPFYYDEMLQPHYTGSLIELIHPFSLLTGALMVSFAVFQASIFLRSKLPEAHLAMLQKLITRSGYFATINFILWFGWISFSSMGYQVVKIPNINLSFNPTVKEVVLAPGAWLHNYFSYPVLWVIPMITVLSMLGAVFLCKMKKPFAILSSSISLAGMVMTTWAMLFPFVLPSSTNPNHSLTLWDVASSSLTLTWMFCATLILLPIVLLYTSWVFKVVNGPVSKLHY